MTKDIKKRWVGSGSQYKGCTYFYNAIQKYGWDNFEHEILYNDLIYQEAINKEKELIELYNTNNSNYGYNIAEGGIGGCTMRGANHTNARKVYQYDLEGNYINEWVCMTEVANILNIPVQNIHQCCNHTNGVEMAGGYQWRYEKLPNIKPYQRKTNPKKPVLQLNENFEIVQKYNGVLDVREPFSKHSIYKCASKDSFRHKGYYWCYEDDFDGFKEYAINRLNNLKKHKN